MTSTSTDPAVPTDPPEASTASSPPADPPEKHTASSSPDDVAAAAVVDEGADAEPDAESVPVDPKRRWSRPVRIAAVAVVVSVPISLAAFAFVRYHSSQDTIHAESSARDVACAYAKTMTNYDAQSIDSYISTVLAGATGDFKTEFAKTSNELKDVIVQAKITSQNRDARCGVESANDSRAEVVVAMSVSISSLGTQGQPVPSQISLVASLDKVDGHWLVSKLDAPALQPLKAAEPATPAK
ncbi:hypothetical protein [Nocardia sp. NBC_00511]|uniref:hypothetical protein n=1 Tax=Nocardia sp. NBC_00511 TaxID=2903591 RepID=UPI0030DDFE8B